MADYSCFYICIFKQEYFKLIKKNSYKNLQDKLVNFLLNEKFESFLNGIRLNGSSEIPFIKKKLNRGGYRLYYLLDVKAKEIYLVFVHPKTGALRIDNIGKEFKKEIYNEVINSVKEKKYFKITIVNNQIKW